MSTPLFALTPKESKGVITLKSPSLAWEAPEWVTPMTLDKAPEKIGYRLSILPYKEDKNADMYVVLPTLGVITPVIFVPPGTQDYIDMTAGKQIEINNYLDRGVMHYPKSGIPGEEGNPVIFGHSNFFKNGVGDYKTIFADIMNLDVGNEDEMRVYVKEEDGEYDLRKFAITKSYETVPTDVEVMRPQGGKELTVFACTNGLAGRWILRGTYIEKSEMLVPYPMKWDMDEFMTIFATKSESERQEIFTTIATKIDAIRGELPRKNQDYHDKFVNYLLKYIETKMIEVL